MASVEVIHITIKLPNGSEIGLAIMESSTYDQLESRLMALIEDTRQPANEHVMSNSEDASTAIAAALQYFDMSRRTSIVRTGVRGRGGAFGAIPWSGIVC